MIAIYYQIKTLIDFWCRWRLNPRSLIKLRETLSFELTGTHERIKLCYEVKKKYLNEYFFYIFNVFIY